MVTNLVKMQNQKILAIREELKAVAASLIIRKQARVGGNLSLARALGDYNVKGINPRPKITMRLLSEIPEKSRLILACDGIYDVSSTRQVATAVKAHKDCSAAELAKNIVYSAYQAGSKDNLTALVVKL